jgi:hypothetical protein
LRSRSSTEASGIGEEVETGLEAGRSAGFGGGAVAGLGAGIFVGLDVKGAAATLLLSCFSGACPATEEATPSRPIVAQSQRLAARRFSMIPSIIESLARARELVADTASSMAYDDRELRDTYQTCMQTGRA